MSEAENVKAGVQADTFTRGLAGTAYALETRTVLHELQVALLFEADAPEFPLIYRHR